MQPIQMFATNTNQIATNTDVSECDYYCGFYDLHILHLPNTINTYQRKHHVHVEESSLKVIKAYNLSYMATVFILSLTWQQILCKWQMHILIYVHI